MKRLILFLLLLVASFCTWSQIGLPIQQAVLPKNSLVVNYDFSKSSSYTRSSTTVNNIASTTSGSATILNSPIFMNSLGFVSFNGSNQYLVTPNLRNHFNTLNASVQKSFTISMWVYPTQLNGVIVSELNSTTPSVGWHATNIELVNGIVKFRVWNGSSITSSSAISLQQWYHIALVYDGTSLKGFVNGVLQGIQTVDREIPATYHHFAIASSEVTNLGSGGNGGFQLAQFKMHHLPLSDRDILQEYELRKNEFDYTIHSPSTNTNPTYWNVSSVWVNDAFYANAPFPTITTGYHLTPWINSPQGWSAATNNTSQYIILNYEDPAFIKGIVTQGRGNNGGQWVTKAHVETSLTSTGPWTRILTNKTINGNSIDDSVSIFTNPVFAKYVKFIPAEWGNHITMRLGVLVKPNNYTTDGLVLKLDAANLKSFAGTGSTWTDMSGLGNNGTLTNSPTFSENAGGAFLFDGVNDRISGVAIPSTAGNNSRTVMVWYKSTAFQNTPLLDKGDGWTASNIAEQLFVTAENGVGDVGNYPATNPGGISLVFWGNDLYYPIAASTLFDGNWHFVAYTYNGSNRSVSICFDGIFANNLYYMNGPWNLLTTKPFTLNTDINTTNNPYWIGQARYRLWGKGHEFANASIPFVSIYNRALSEAEILTNYNTTKPRY